MEIVDKKSHWENIYTSKQLHEVSWYQSIPETSLEYVKQIDLPLNASIIDVGGGDSFLVDYLLVLGYTNITILDISSAAIERAKKRLGEKAERVTWIVSDILEFISGQQYDFWHDRAVFHFITKDEEILTYKKNLISQLSEDARVLIGTFSFNGPLKCSGIEIKQYSSETMKITLSPELKWISSQYVDHKTPFETTQNFVFCLFKKK